MTLRFLIDVHLLTLMGKSWSVRCVGFGQILPETAIQTTIVITTIQKSKSTLIARYHFDIYLRIYENDPELPKWDSFDENQGWYVFQSPAGGNKTAGTDPNRVSRMENGFKTEVCEFWDYMDAYLKI